MRLASIRVGNMTIGDPRHGCRGREADLVGRSPASSGRGSSSRIKHYCQSIFAALAVLACCGMATVALAQQTASTDNMPRRPEAAAPDRVERTASTAEPQGPREVPVDTTPTAGDIPVPREAAVDPTASAGSDIPDARELPLDSEPFDARVHRRVEEYGQRHQQRQRQTVSYDKVTGGDPGLERFADPRKVQVQLSDELDREQTSDELSGDYAEQAHGVQSKVQALQDFIAKRHQAIEELNQHNGGASHRQDLEVALANLARQPLSPETLGEMREIDARLSETERNEKELPPQLAQTQQEATEAAAELAKLQSLEQAYEKESKAFNADALSARQNRLRLAGKLEYYIVRAQAEDELEQGRKAIASVQHLSASPEVESLLMGPGSSSKSDSDLQQLRDCIRDSGDVRGCRQTAHKE